MQIKYETKSSNFITEAWKTNLRACGNNLADDNAWTAAVEAEIPASTLRKLDV